MVIFHSYGGEEGCGVRICIDFRAINSVTQPDPYQMPLIEEILETLASAKFISKIDLNKGFHQNLGTFQKQPSVRLGESLNFV